jgi:hypothetical protein
VWHGRRLSRNGREPDIWKIRKCFDAASRNLGFKGRYLGILLGTAASGER